MKILMLCREGRDYSRAAAEFVEMIRRRYPDRPVTEVNIDTRDGAATASLYDVIEYPAIIVTNDDGSVLDSWQGMPLPLIDQVMSAVVK